MESKYDFKQAPKYKGLFVSTDPFGIGSRVWCQQDSMMDKVLPSQVRGRAHSRPTRSSGSMLPARASSSKGLEQPPLSKGTSRRNLSLSRDPVTVSILDRPEPPMGLDLPVFQSQDLILGSEMGDKATPWDNTECSLNQLKSAVDSGPSGSRAVKRKVTSEVVPSKKSKSEVSTPRESRPYFRSPLQTRDSSE